MTTERKEETVPVTVQIGVCSVCHALFLISGDRETSPCHGADPLVILATLGVAPNGDVAGVWGQPPAAREPDITEEPAPPVEEEPPAPAEEVPEVAKEEEIDDLNDLLQAIGMYLAVSGLAGDDVATGFMRMGAEPEAAATAVGRLSAVRDLLGQLQQPPEPTPVAPAPSEAESSPENT